MKKFHGLIYVLLLAALVLPLSGCGGSSGGSGSSNNQSNTSADKLMVIESPVLVKDESYRFYRGSSVKVRASTSTDYNPTYYVAPIAVNSDTVTVNLEFSEAFSADQPFLITKEDDDPNVVFY